MATRPVLQGNILDSATLRTQKERPFCWEYPLKLEPIVHLSSARTFGYEVLTQVPFHVNTEHFFATSRQKNSGEFLSASRHYYALSQRRTLFS